MAAAPHLELSAGTMRTWVVMAWATPSMSSAWPFLECPRCWFLGWVLSTHKYVSWVTLNVVKSTRKIIPHSPGGPLQEHSGLPHLQVNGLAHPLLLHSLEPPYVSFPEFWLGAPHPRQSGVLAMALSSISFSDIQSSFEKQKHGSSSPSPQVGTGMDGEEEGDGNKSSSRLRFHTQQPLKSPGEGVVSLHLPGEGGATGICPTPTPAQAFLEGQEQ